MSDIYKLTITPSRGVVYSGVPSFENPQVPAHLPTEFHGVRLLGTIVGGSAAGNASNLNYFTFSNLTTIVSNGGASKSDLRMNNSDPTLVTRIGFNSNFSGLLTQFNTVFNSTRTPKGYFFIRSLQSTGVSKYSIYHITNLIISNETHRFYDLTVSYVGGTATNFAGNPVGFSTVQHDFLWDTSVNFIGTPSNPWGISGSKDAINSLLQKIAPFSWSWNDHPTNFQVQPNPEIVNIFTASPITTPVDLAFSLTKNGTPLTDWTTYFEFKTQAEARNPFGY